MCETNLNKNTISLIFKENKIAKVNQINHLNIGFTNDLYIINDKYVLKVCINEKNEENFYREVFFYEHFKGIIQIPHIIVSDTSKKFINKCYIIYEKIIGDNLYSKWHLLSDINRKDIVRELATIINNISSIEYKTFCNHFKISEELNWHDLKYNSLQEKLYHIKETKILDNKFISSIEQYIENNHGSLLEQRVGLAYTDLHFDNVLILNGKVTALLDFERTDLLSIDYTLDTIKRLSEHPYLYACEEYEQYVKEEDYTEVLKWFREFSPQIFDFKDLDIRLALYSIEYDMRLLIKFPKAEGLKIRLAKTIGYNI